MASETESLTTMQAAFLKAGLTTTETAQRVNRIKHSEKLKEQDKENQRLDTIVAKAMTAMSGRVQTRKPNQNRKSNVQKVG
jgi:hypothetical protein